jgi:hypothetical protein
VKRTLIIAASVFCGEFCVRVVNFPIPIFRARFCDSSALGKYSFSLACAVRAALLPDLGLHLLTTLSLRRESLFFSVRIFAHSALSLAVHILLGLGLLHVGLDSIQTLLVVLAVYFFVTLASNNFPKKRELLLLAR